MYPQRGDGYYEMEAGALVIYLIRVGFFCLHRRPDGGCTPAIKISFFFRWWKAKKVAFQTSCFGRWIIVVVAAWFVKKSATPSCAEKGLLEAFSLCESHLRHKTKSWRCMYISWPASRSPFSLKTSGLTHAQNQPPFVQPPVLIVLISVSSTFAV